MEAAAPPRLSIYLRLGRVSNLPTIWSNAWAGALLTGATLDATLAILLPLALSLFYVAGMFLNDAFDVDFDRQHRPERPIPSGHISRAEVYALGSSLLASGLALLLVAAESAGASLAAPLVTGALLGALIVYYNWRHKQDPLSPLVMALCRAMTYVTAAAVAGQVLAPQVWAGAAALTAWVIGLSYVAKQENLREVKNLWPLACLAGPVVYGLFAGEGQVWVWPMAAALAAWAAFSVSFLVRRAGRSIPRAVVSLIAGISLVDALLVLAIGAPPAWIAACVAAFLFTLAFQRFVPGT